MEAESVERMLGGIVGAHHLLVHRDLLSSYEVDWTGYYRGVARAVVRPGTTEEVAACLRICSTERIPVVVQGGNTGLVGGSVPDDTGESVILSTSRLRSIGAVDGIARQVTVDAGVPLSALQAALSGSGLAFGVDLAPRDSATLGGMAATNAGGIHVLRHGSMRSQIAGLEAVLSSGAVLSHLDGLTKDNTGYDLDGLLCGSEGTLAALTRLRLRLVPVPAHRTTALLAWEGLDPMVAALATLRLALTGIEVAEYMVRAGVDLVRSQFGVSDPFRSPYPAYLLIEVAGPVPVTEHLAEVAGALPGLCDAAIPTSTAHRDDLLALRELHTAALAAVGPPRKYDVTVPLGHLRRFVDAAAAVVGQWVGSGARVHHFGHLGDGNVHVNVLGTGGLDSHQLERLDGAIYKLVTEVGGSISAEHGIGRAKRPWLHLARSPDELAAFRAIKDALDPTGILNPDVILESHPRDVRPTGSRAG